MDRSGRKGAFFTFLGLVALGALVLLVAPLREAVGNVLSGDAGELLQELRDLGPAGALVLLALMLVHAVMPFPSELVNAAAGFVYGFWIASRSRCSAGCCPRWRPTRSGARRRGQRCSGSWGRSGWTRARGSSSAAG